MAIHLDYPNMMSPPIEGGITAAESSDAATAFTTAHKTVAGLHADRTRGFLDLPDDRELHRQTTDYVAQLRRDGRYPTDVVVLGIGGSALGPIALRTSLRAPGWNLLDDAARNGEPRLHVLDNVDPANIAALLSRLDLSRALFVVTSQSAGTAATTAQYIG